MRNCFLYKADTNEFNNNENSYFRRKRFTISYSVVICLEFSAYSIMVYYEEIWLFIY
jgi:hypothetical protein